MRKVKIEAHKLRIFETAMHELHKSAVFGMWAALFFLFLTLAITLLSTNFIFYIVIFFLGLPALICFSLSILFFLRYKSIAGQ